MNWDCFRKGQEVRVRVRGWNKAYVTEVHKDSVEVVLVRMEKVTRIFDLRNITPWKQPNSKNSLTSADPQLLDW